MIFLIQIFWKTKLTFCFFCIDLPRMKQFASQFFFLVQKNPMHKSRWKLKPKNSQSILKISPPFQSEKWKSVVYIHVFISVSLSVKKGHWSICHFSTQIYSFCGQKVLVLWSSKQNLHIGTASKKTRIGGKGILKSGMGSQFVLLCMWTSYSGSTHM